MKILSLYEDTKRMEDIYQALYRSSPEAARKYKMLMHHRAYLNQQTVHL